MNLFQHILMCFFILTIGRIFLIDPNVFIKCDYDNEFKFVKLLCYHNPFYINDSSCFFRSFNRTAKVLAGHINIYRQHGNYYANGKAFRKPLYTPGGYVKLAELQDEFCKYVRVGSISDRLLTVASEFVKGRTNYPTRCPVPPGFYYLNETDYDPKVIQFFLPTGRYRVIVETTQIRDGAMLSYFDFIVLITRRTGVSKFW